MMRKKTIAIPALAVFVLAVFTAVGVRTFFGPCVHEDGSFGACHWAGKAVFASALLIAAQSLAALLMQAGGVRKGLYLAMTLTAVMGMLQPGILISLCSMATMRCRALMRPAVMILFAAMALTALTGCMTVRTDEKGQGGYAGGALRMRS